MTKSSSPNSGKESRPRIARHIATAGPAEPANCSDRAFAEAMIAHYKSSIKAAQLMQESGSDVHLHCLAGSIIASHRSDSDMLRDWLRRCHEAERRDLRGTAKP